MVTYITLGLDTNTEKRMKIDFTRLDDLNARIKIVIERADYAGKLEENLKNYSKKLNLKGFRAGKTPKSVLTKMYGKGLLEESVTSVLNDKLFKYLEEEHIEFIGSPMPTEDSEPLDFNPKDPSDYSFEFELGLKPSFTLQYNLTEPVEVRTILSDQDSIDEELLNYRRLFGEDVQIEDGVVERHDKLILKLTPVLSEGPDPEKSIETSIDLKQFTEEVSDKLTGLKKGDSMEVDLEEFLGMSRQFILKNILKLEEDPHPDTPLKYQFEILGIRRPQTSELSGEQISKFMGREVENEDEFRKMLEAREQTANDEKVKEMKKLALRKALLEANPFTLPEAFLLKWVNSQRDKKIEEGSKEATNLFRDAKWSLLLDRIQKDAALEVTDKDVQNQVTDWVIQNIDYRRADVRKVMEGLYKNEYFMSTMKERALEDVVFAHIMPQVNFTETEGTMHEFEHAFHDMHHELFDHGDHAHD